MKATVFNYQIVKDPEIFEQNRLPAHSDHLFYRNRPGDCEYCLNGLWKFAYAKNYEQSIKGFEAPDYDCHGWDQIPVPAHIQLQGYDTPQYVNTQYPWDGHEDVRPGQIPVRYNPTASYVKYFDVPQHMKGLPLFISFRGVESAFALWLNGQYVGYSEDSFTPADFDLTPYITEGENKLAVQVFKWCSGSWCEDQDFFRFSGIFRDVVLYVRPACHIEDLRIRTVLDDTYREASLELDLKTGTAGDCQAEITLTDAEGKKAAGLMIESGKIRDGGAISMAVAAPHLWSAEDPYLYDLKIELRDGSGKTAETVTEKVGFRRFEIRDAVMCLNGKRIVFKGVNRHEFCAESGRVIDDEIILKDLVTMKRNNINAVRTSHYPNRTALYRLCDRLGLYVIDETNLETHGSWD
ncbi:MAG: beta-galactosidase, partial [Lachnospiraceae bacterium]|nr:beta-galactosidase [Lachnospiraceae bacterium]